LGAQVDKSKISESIDRARDALLARQDERGAWIGEVGRTTIPLLMHLLSQWKLGRGKTESTRRAMEWLYKNQNGDGGWGQWLGDPSSLEYTRIARRLIRALFGNEEVALAADEFVRARESDGSGVSEGLENILAQTVLASVGEEPWEQIPLPALPLAVFGVERGMLPGPMPYAGLAAVLLKWRNTKKRLPWDGYFIKRAERWLFEHQGDDGSWQGSIHTTALVNTALIENPAAEKAIRRALEYNDSVQLDDGGFGMVKTLTTWETVLSVLALQATRPGESEPAVKRAAKWLESVQLPDGSWAWDFHPGKRLYGDVDDTVFGALAISRALPGSTSVAQAIGWVKRLQGPQGGWATFSKVMRRPDMAWAVADITGHAVEALAELLGNGAKPVLDGARWLIANQDGEGWWRGYWGARRVYGTSTALAGLAAAGDAGQQEAIARAARWLRSVQNDDGGWGENWLAEQAPSTAEQTAWALSGLSASGAGTSDPAILKGLEWLLEHQNVDGSWDYSMVGSFTHRYMGSFGTEIYGIVYPMLALCAWRDRE
jgi:squalene-hopene/tetraprenyl-beta-curcumene cyclase